MRDAPIRRRVASSIRNAALMQRWPIEKHDQKKPPKCRDLRVASSVSKWRDYRGRLKLAAEITADAG